MISKDNKNPSLCIFANFFIDNLERLDRMKNSFLSFKDLSPNEWRVNIRGRYKKEAGEFLASELGKVLKLKFIETKRGWFKDSYSFMKDVKTEFIFFWVEDHICLVDPASLWDVIKEMKQLRVDQLRYSFLHKKTLKVFNILPKIHNGQYIDVARIDRHSSRKVRKKLSMDFYVVSVLGIFKRDFFFSVLLSNRPYLKRWPKYLPFDFEKKSKDNVVDLIHTALPKLELFASIDDDHTIEGYSLISRGIYKENISRAKLKEIEFISKTNFFKTMCLKFMPYFVLKIVKFLNRLFKRILYSIQYLY